MFFQMTTTTYTFSDFLMMSFHTNCPSFMTITICLLAEQFPFHYRFCSGLGVAGAVPLTFSYLAETCPRATRTRYTGLLHSFWPLGALLTSSIAHFTLPNNGAETVLDNQEHWSSWHKFLILNIVPMIVCIVGLIWASESPRYLLEASREVEALAVYQRLHRLNKARTQYGLTELELPGRSAYRDRPVSPSRNVFRHGVDTVCGLKFENVAE